jgi:hypothetical protein
MGCNRPVQGLLYLFTFNSVSKKYDCRKYCLAAGFIWCYPTNLTSTKSVPKLWVLHKNEGSGDSVSTYTGNATAMQ